jgi:cysteine desulfurase / selenocysteine lyase
MNRPVSALRPQIVGLDHPVPLLNGRSRPYINLDNAASTPALQPVLDAINQFMPYYASVHRGTGFKSRLSTVAYDQAHEIIGRFVGADLDSNTVIFGKNSTEALNKLAYRFPFQPDSVVITTQLEHHSNDLPWRKHADVRHVRALANGRFDEDHFDHLLAQHAGRVALVAVTGASNVSGFLQPIHRLARKAHAAGAMILVDAAQLAPHRRVDMRPDDDPEHLDFVVLSGHKMYAPFGTGALIGPKAIFLQSPPDYVGGGTVDVVTLDEVHWAGMPDRDEAGSPNVVGAVAMAAAAQLLMEVGMEQIAAHEEELIAYALTELQKVPGLTFTARPTRPAPTRRWASSPSIWQASPTSSWRPFWAMRAGLACAAAAFAPIPTWSICCNWTKRRPTPGAISCFPATNRICLVWYAPALAAITIRQT